MTRRKSQGVGVGTLAWHELTLSRAREALKELEARDNPDPERIKAAQDEVATWEKMVRNYVA